MPPPCRMQVAEITPWKCCGQTPSVSSADYRARMPGAPGMRSHPCPMTPGTQHPKASIASDFNHASSNTVCSAKVPQFANEAAGYHPVVGAQLANVAGRGARGTNQRHVGDAIHDLLVNDQAPHCGANLTSCTCRAEGDRAHGAPEYLVSAVGILCVSCVALPRAASARRL
jgi:hypothetical protein